MTSGKGSRGTRCVLGFESLEDRTVPAGNVNVSVLDHVLYVNGDAADNRIWISGFGKNSVVIRSIDATTTINGKAGPAFFDSVKKGYSVNLGDGNDGLAITDTQGKGGVDVRMGAGDDAVTLINCKHRGGTALRMGDGNDSVLIQKSELRDYLLVDPGAGNDQVTIDQVIGKGLFGLNVSGVDFLNLGRVSFGVTQMGGFLPGSSPIAGVGADFLPPTVALTSDTPQAIRGGTIDFTATFSEAVTGFSAAGVSVSNGSVTSFTPVDAQTYRFSVTPAADGTVTASVNAGAAFDAARNPNVASDPVARTVDTVAPTVTVNSQTTNDTTPTITGTVSESNAAVAVTINNRTFDATVTGNTWSVTVPTALAQNTYPVTAKATDPAGNSSSATGTVVIDTAAPATPTLNLLAADDTGGAGHVGDLRTELTTVRLTGTAEAGSTVTITRNQVPGTPGTGPLVTTVTAGSNGTYTAIVSLAVGPNSFSARATDAAGNASAAVSQTFTRNTPPTAATQQPVSVNSGQTTTVDLTNVFSDAEQVVRLTVSYPDTAGGTVNGSIDINTFPGVAPQNVANFLAYVNNQTAGQGYDGTIFHRLAPNFVLQGGGFTFSDATKTFTALTKMAAVVNEPNVSNTLGTVAFAKLPAFNDTNNNGVQDPGETSIPGGGPNSATDEFFFNLGDNSGNLDAQNGGFTVFGQVMNGGLTTLADINTKLSTFSGTGVPGAPPFPIRQGANTTNFPTNVSAADMVQLTSADVLTAAQRMSFSLVGVDGGANPAVATVMLTGSGLSITGVAQGTTTVTVRAMDLDGSITDTTITINVP